MLTINSNQNQSHPAFKAISNLEGIPEGVFNPLQARRIAGFIENSIGNARDTVEIRGGKTVDLNDDFIDVEKKGFIFSVKAYIGRKSQIRTVTREGDFSSKDKLEVLMESLKELATF